MLTTKKSVGLVFGCLLATLTACKPSGSRLVKDGERYLHEGNYQKAIVKLRSAVEVMPTQAPVWNHLGLAYHGANEISNAAIAYRHALDLNRDLAAARYNLGCLYLEQQSLKPAIAEFMTFTALQPHSLDGWLKLAAAQWQDKQSDNAEKSFQQAIKLQPRHPAALNGLGMIQMSRRRPQEAATYFHGALQQSPGYAPAVLNLAVLAHQQFNDRPLALKKYQEYLSLQPRPDNWESVKVIADKLETELRPHSAPSQSPVSVAATAPPVSLTNALLTVLRTNPAPKVPVATTSAPPVLVARTPAVKTNLPPAPEPRSKVIVAEIPDEAPIRPAQDKPPTLPVTAKAAPPKPAPARATPALTKPSPSLETPSLTEDKSFLDRLNPVRWRRPKKEAPVRPTPLEAKPSHVVPLAAVSGGASSKPVGAPVFPRYKYQNPGKPVAGNRAQAEGLFEAGVKAQREGKLREAREAYQAAGNIDPSYFDPLYNLGLAAYQAGEWKESLAAYEKALAINPLSVNARLNFALTLERAKYPIDAAKELARILLIEPEEIRVHLGLGNLYAQDLAEPLKARQHYLKVLEKEPRHPQAMAIRYWLANN